MTEARAERVQADPLLARAHLNRAHEFLDDAGRAESLATKQVLCYQACVAGMEATVQAAGIRVRPGSGYHRLLLDEVSRVVTPNRADLLESIGEARELRADVSYYAGFVSEDDVASMESSARGLLAEVDRFLAERQE